MWSIIRVVKRSTAQTLLGQFLFTKNQLSALLLLPWKITSSFAVPSAFFSKYCFSCMFCYVFLTVFSRFNSCEQPTWRTVPFLYMFIPILYMFRTPLCSSSGESIVLTRHLVYVYGIYWITTVTHNNFII